MRPENYWFYLVFLKGCNLVQNFTHIYSSENVLNINDDCFFSTHLVLKVWYLPRSFWSFDYRQLHSNTERSSQMDGPVTIKFINHRSHIHSVFLNFDFSPLSAQGISKMKEVRQDRHSSSFWWQIIFQTNKNSWKIINLLFWAALISFKLNLTSGPSVANAPEK